MCRDEASGVLFAADYGKDLLVFRITDEGSIFTVQAMRDIHVDYAFHMVCQYNRLYTCSLTQKVSAIEFNLSF